MAKLKDLTNQRFGRLMAICPMEKRSKSRNVIWLCRCGCGKLTTVVSGNLLTGNIKSCGCLRREKMGELSIRHGDTANGKMPRLYVIWGEMKYRCLNPNNKSYKYYGKKGISVCEEWKNSYLAFKWWAIFHGYASDLTIDRINHKGNYEPINCQWITRSENTKKAYKDRRKKNGTLLRKNT